jgi:hypothetical protein
MERMMRKIIPLQFACRERDIHQGGVLGDDEGGGQRNEEKKKEGLVNDSLCSFCKDYEHRKGELMGMLVERRKNPMRIAKDSVMNWGKMLLGDYVDNKNIFFKRATIDDFIGRILWVNLSFNNHSIIQ